MRGVPAHAGAYHPWEGMGALQSTVALRRLTIFGPVNDELRAWIDKAGLSYTHYDTLALGFTRA